jgi:arabinofuranosyltransferase
VVRAEGLADLAAEDRRRAVSAPVQEQARARGRWLGPLLFAVAFAALALHTLRFLPFISDDALISLTYAKRLTQGHGLTWNGGLYVEGYSNLLWVLATGALGALGLDLIVAARVLGYAFVGAALAAFAYAHRPANLRDALPTLCAMLFVALSGSFGAWTVGGLEQPLLACLLAWAVVLSYPRLERRRVAAREMLAPAIFYALLCLTRLDGPLYTAAAVLAVFLCGGLNRDSLRRAFGLAVLPVLFVVGQEAFRLWYYGEWVPNTALVKFHPSGTHALGGLAYLGAGALAALPFLCLAALSAFVCFRQRFRRERVTLLLTLAAAWAFYVASIGGDIFPAWRHFVPFALLFALLLAEGGAWLARHAGRRAYLAAVLAAALALALFAFLQYRDEENFRAVSERWEWDAEPVGLLFKRAFAAEQPLMAIDPAGGLPFWSELPALDMLGLNDKHLPRHPPPNLGQGPIAHEFGDGQYVLSRRPDLVVFLLPTGNDHGYFLSGRQMQQDPRFFRDYTLVRFEAHEPRRVTARVWVRKESERIGVRRAPARVTVPGFLICDHHWSVARLGADGRLVVPITQNRAALLQNFELPAGRWRVEANASSPSVKVFVTKYEAARREPNAQVASDSPQPQRLLDAATPAVLDWAGGPLNVELFAPHAGTVEVHELTFTLIQD